MSTRQWMSLPFVQKSTTSWARHRKKSLAFPFSPFSASRSRRDGELTSPSRHLRICVNAGLLAPPPNGDAPAGAACPNGDAPEAAAPKPPPEPRRAHPADPVDAHAQAKPNLPPEL